jgi:hypothetical protein
MTRALGPLVRPQDHTVTPNSALMPDAFSSLRFACGAAKRER